MSKKDKLIERLLKKPKDFTFDEIDYIITDKKPPEKFLKKIEQSKNGGGYGGGRGTVNVDTQTQEQRDESSCREFEKLGIELPEECKK